MIVTIVEEGNGFPDAGDIVKYQDDSLGDTLFFRVVGPSEGASIQTADAWDCAAGRTANTLEMEVENVTEDDACDRGETWGGCEADDPGLSWCECGIFPCEVVMEDDDDDDEDDEWRGGRISED